MGSAILGDALQGLGGGMIDIAKIQMAEEAERRKQDYLDSRWKTRTDYEHSLKVKDRDYEYKKDMEMYKAKADYTSGKAGKWETITVDGAKVQRNTVTGKLEGLPKAVKGKGWKSMEVVVDDIEGTKTTILYDPDNPKDIRVYDPAKKSMVNPGEKDRPPAPSWEQFYNAAKKDPRNKGASDQELKDFYDQKYSKGAAGAIPTKESTQKSPPPNKAVSTEREPDIQKKMMKGNGDRETSKSKPKKSTGGLLTQVIESAGQAKNTKVSSDLQEPFQGVQDVKNLLAKAKGWKAKRAIQPIIESLKQGQPPSKEKIAAVKRRMKSLELSINDIPEEVRKYL